MPSPAAQPLLGVDRMPRPLIGLRDHMELERKLLENLIPELSETEMDKPRAATEWASFLVRLHEGLVKWSRVNIQEGGTFSRFRDLAAKGFARFKSRAFRGQ